MLKTVLRFKEVQARTGLSRSHIYNLVKDGQFPRPIKISHRAVGFLESEVDAWQEAKIQKRDQAA